MNTINLPTLTVAGARMALKEKKYTSRELTQACLQAIKEKNPEVFAFIEVFDDALQQADDADKKIGEGIDLPLLGVPIGLKDNILVRGHIASAASTMLKSFVAPVDSTAARKLKEAGAVIIGRTNMDDAAMGGSTESSIYGPTKNPLDQSRVPGGSSGGSAAAVAAHMIPAALGSDTGGSIRQPAAFTGLVGFKPTYGRVSRSGLIAMASSLDQIGPFAKSVSDAELIYNTLKGKDPMDSTTIDDATYPVQKPFSKTMGVPRAFFSGDGVNESVKQNLDAAVTRLKTLGYTVEDIELPTLAYSLAVYYILMPAEVSSNLGRLDGVRYGFHKAGTSGIDDYFKSRGEGFGREVRRRIILGTYVLSSGYYDAYYGTALAVKDLITREFRDAFKKVDLILTPTTPTPAFMFGEKSSPLDMYLADIFTVPANIAGVPAISLPFGYEEKDGASLPLGVQLMADLGREDNIFAAGKDLMGESDSVSSL